MKVKEPKILYLIQLPPPVHGVSTINSIIYSSPLINAGITKLLLELKFSDTLTQLRRFNLTKIRRFFTLAGNLSRVLRDERPDYVYFSAIFVGKGFWRDLLLIRIIKRSGTVPIYHIHNRGINLNSKRSGFRTLYRYVFKNSIGIHLSEKLLELEIKPHQGEKTRFFSVPNGIPDIPPADKPSKKGPITLLFISNLFKEKGIFDLLRIMSGVKKLRSDIHLKISGEFLRESIRRKLLKSIRDMGLEDIVYLEDPVYEEAKAGAFRESDIFIFPSFFWMESFPLVILEAMRQGLPVISSEIAAIPEMLENNKEGILVKEKDFDGFIKAILRLADDPALREEMGSAGRQRFLNNYTSAHLEENMRHVFKECVLKNK